MLIFWIANVISAHSFIRTLAKQTTEQLACTLVLCCRLAPSRAHQRYNQRLEH